MGRVGNEDLGLGAEKGNRSWGEGVRLGISLCLYAMSFNVPALPNPPSWARHLRFCPSANAVTRQGLGGVSPATEAGNAVLCDGQSHRVCPDGKPDASEYLKEPPALSWASAKRMNCLIRCKGIVTLRPVLFVCNA